jgi:hypothetical protein
MKEVSMARKVLVLVLAQFLFALPVFAQTQVPLKTHAFEVGAETYYMKYEEPGIMENEGWMAGVIASYTFRRNIMARIEARVAAGEVDYSSTNTGSDDSISDVAFETRGLLGWDFRPGTWLITPFVGFGYRYLNDDSEGTVTTTGARGYERESNYYYSPIGIEALTSLPNGWSLGMSAEYDLFWSGTQKSRLSGAIAGLSDLENDQNGGYGVRFSANLHKKFTPLSLKFGPFFRYWKIDDSDVAPITFGGVLVGYGLEPNNKTYEIGAMVSVTF